MADKLTEALVLFVEACPHVVSTRDLVSKVRVELEQNFHREDGKVEGSSLVGDPVQDIRIVAERINTLFPEKRDDKPAEEP